MPLGTVFPFCPRCQGWELWLEFDANPTSVIEVKTWKF